MRQDYWRVYIVMVKPKGKGRYEPFKRLGDIVAHETRRQAEGELPIAKSVFGKENAYIQKCGAIS